MAARVAGSVTTTNCIDSVVAARWRLQRGGDALPDQLRRDGRLVVETAAHGAGGREQFVGREVQHGPDTRAAVRSARDRDHGHHDRRGHVHRRRRRTRRRGGGPPAARLPAVPPHVARHRPGVGRRRLPRRRPRPARLHAGRAAGRRWTPTPRHGSWPTSSISPTCSAPSTSTSSGHDWGGQVAWLTAAQHPDRSLTLTVLSRPHPAAFARSFADDPGQSERSKHHRAMTPGADRPLVGRRLRRAAHDARPRRRPIRRRRCLPGDVHGARRTRRGDELVPRRGRVRHRPARRRHPRRRPCRCCTCGAPPTSPSGGGPPS